MSLIELYYYCKPFLPWHARLMLRRFHARRVRSRSKKFWPIQESARLAPGGWPGWPQQKKFAVALSHDVEGSKGVDRCLRLMELQVRLGFRSSFNFIPKGDYSTPKDLRESLTKSGFEIGVHDLKHDGKLYLSRAHFQLQAKEINRYLAEWNACGFRAGFMHHQLAWHHDLNVLYDASTFDTDPFEPQPDGVDTIFPFWVPAPEGTGGYVELPYTLPQDHTLFIVLGESTIDIWKKKIDWIARHGGMAFIDTHPDYMNFTGNTGSNEYSASLYEEFLCYIQSRHAGQYWHALPREVADFARVNRNGLRLQRSPNNAHICRSFATAAM